VRDYTLYYWPIPFRGQFIRAVLAQVGAQWDEADFDTIIELKDKPPRAQPVPHMAPPVLIDHRENVALSQLPAILMYLGGKYELLPSATTEQQGGQAGDDALVLKLILDANDVLYEMTRHNGDQMWDAEAWSDFLPRLRRWMSVFEAAIQRWDLSDNGFLFNRKSAGLADLVVATLWGVMTEKLPALRPLLEETAPAVADLTDWVTASPAQVELRRTSDAAYGEEWCSGQIEVSLRAVLATE
jgi:glutathione S-transferase